jgi:hypothetical protein
MSQSYHEEPSKDVRMVRIDDGRRLLAIATLAAGGAAAALAVGSLLYSGFFVARPPIQFDILLAAVGGIATFIYLLLVTPVFYRRKPDK